MVTSNGSAADGIFILFSSQLYPDAEELKPWQGQERAISLLQVIFAVKSLSRKLDCIDWWDG